METITIHPSGIQPCPDGRRADSDFVPKSAAALIAVPALASDEGDVAGTVKQYNDDFNKGDVKSAAALCTAQTFIIDDFAPHAWKGANTCMDWAQALAAADKKDGITNEIV